MKNLFEVRGDVTIIFARYKKFEFEVAINTTQFDLVNSFGGTWAVDYRSKGNRFYVCLKKDERNIYLHRLLKGFPVGKDVDHFNGNPFDNRDENLREASRSENCQNKQRANRNNTSGIMCVHFHWSKWVAKIKINYKDIMLGRFNNIEDAEAAVIKARAEMMPYSQEATESKVKNESLIKRN